MLARMPQRPQFSGAATMVFSAQTGRFAAIDRAAAAMPTPTSPAVSIGLVADTRE